MGNLQARLHIYESEKKIQQLDDISLESIDVVLRGLPDGITADNLQLLVYDPDDLTSIVARCDLFAVYGDYFKGELIVNTTECIAVFTGAGATGLGDELRFPCRVRNSALDNEYAFDDIKIKYSPTTSVGDVTGPDTEYIKVMIEFSIDGATDWHGEDESTASDSYFRFSNDGGATWGSAVLYRGEKGDTGEVGADGADGEDGVNAYVYIAFASSNSGTGWNLTPNASLPYMAVIQSTSELTPVESDFASATWIKYIGDNGADGADGADGSNGANAYLYIAFASDNSGTGWSLTPTDSLKYRAEVQSNTVLTPVSSDFSGATWIKYIGDTGEAGAAGADGADGSDGTDAFIYVAYASDNTGTGWSLTPSDLLKYRAEIHSDTALTPIESDFSGATWVKYLGNDGDAAPFNEAFTSANIAGKFSWADNVLTVTHGLSSPYLNTNIWLGGVECEYTTEPVDNNSLKIYFPISQVPISGTGRILIGFGANQGSSVVASAANISGAVALDYADGDVQPCVTTGAVTGITISNISSGDSMVVFIDNSGGYAVTFGSEEIIASSETGKYNLVFSNIADTIYYMGKSEAISAS